MADSSVSSQRDDDKISSMDNVDPSHVPNLRSSASHTSSHCTYDRDRRACNLDLNNSPSLRPGSAARDSGYNTDVSPAATISPATNTTRQQHFVFDNISHSHIPELEDRISSLSHISPHLASGGIAISPLTPSSHPPYQLHFEQRSRCTPPLRLSPDIFKVCASPGRTVCPGTQTPSRPVSESSDTNRVQFDFDSDNEEDNTNRRENNSTSNRLLVTPSASGEHFDISESCLGLPLPILSHDSDDGDDEDVFHKSDDILKNWGVGSESQTPRSRNTPRNRNSLSLRQRRYCSADDDESLIGACGGRSPNRDSLCSVNQAVDQRRHSFNDTNQRDATDQRTSVRKTASGSEIKGSAHTNTFLACPQSETSLTHSRHLQPCHYDVPNSRDCDNLFTFDSDDIDGDEESTYSRDARPVTTPRDRPCHHSVIRTRLRCISVTAYLRLPSSCLLPWSSSIDRVSVSTQTPHVTSIMIQQILDTPLPLPNEARGTAVALLRRRQSEGGILLPPGSRPLPDIIPSGRDRSMSVPDAMTLARMQRAREVGRELRRLSDEFHFGMFGAIPVPEAAAGRFPRMGSRYINNLVTFFRNTFLRRSRGPFHNRRSTSVDRADHATSMSLSEHAEDLPGD